MRREDLKCFECEGFGHMRSDCPGTQRRELKCYECRDIGHIQRECPNSKKEICNYYLVSFDINTSRWADSISRIKPGPESPYITLADFRHIIYSFRIYSFRPLLRPKTHY